MAVVALVCIGLGTWQISRYDWKHTANDDLRRNSEVAPVPVAQALPLLPNKPDTDSVEYRRVTATGTYDATHQVLVRKVQVNGQNGYYVLTPLRTQGRFLLVVRGFVATTQLPAPPDGTVSITGRVRPSDTADDKAAELTGQVESINAGQQAQRLGAPTYAGYVELLDGQPGTSGITAIPAPDLSNPAGGAIEPQHIAYIMQWYIFAALAVAGPLVLARAEARNADEDSDGRPRPTGPSALTTGSDAATVERKLSERYGRSAPAGQRSKPVSRRQPL